MQEVTNALKRTKRGKAGGVDEVGSALLRSDIETTATALTRLYNNCGMLESGQDCGRKISSLTYSRKAAYSTVTTGEE